MLPDREQTKKDYADIINLPHPISKTHNPMPMEMRASQFAPFSALVGLDVALDTTATTAMQQIDFDYYSFLLEFENFDDFINE